MILTSDIHLTDRKEDDYRWGLFGFLKDLVISSSSKRVFILGDLTIFKDNHSSKLVNRLVSGILDIVSVGCEVHILMGNHDYLDAGQPFFGFLNNLDGVHYYSSIQHCVGDTSILMLPHTRNPLEDWGRAEGIREYLRKFNTVMMHQTIDQSVASNGQRMEGMSRSLFKGARARIYSGDIHVPQDIARVTYIGAPYPITYGDSYNPRVLVVRKGKERSECFETIKKHTIIVRDIEDASVFEGVGVGDQVKLRIEVCQGEDWEFKKDRSVKTLEGLGASSIVTELIPSETRSERKRLSQKNVNYKVTPEEALKVFVRRSRIKSSIALRGLSIIGQHLRSGKHDT